MQKHYYTNERNHQILISFGENDASGNNILYLNQHFYIGDQPEENTTFRGDVNLDGEVGVADVTLIISHILGNTVGNIHIENADVNQDNHINIGDMSRLIAMLLNQ